MKIGVDLGGTQMRAALLDADGHISHQRIVPTLAANSAADVTQRMAQLIRSLPDWDAADFIGVGAPCGVSRDGASLKLASNLPGMDGYPLRDELSASLGRSVMLENDANVACLGEALRGAGTGHAHVVYVTISTGIGGGYYSDGWLLRGANGLATEFGSMSIDPSRVGKNGLPRGAAEGELSGVALVARACELTGKSYPHAGAVFDLAAAGDVKLQALVADFVHGMGVLLANIACVLDPDVFVLGGGCMKSSAHFLPQVTAQYRAFAQAEFAHIPIVRAKLGEPGLVGASLLEQVR